MLSRMVIFWWKQKLPDGSQVVTASLSNCHPCLFAFESLQLPPWNLGGSAKTSLVFWSPLRSRISQRSPRRTYLELANYVLKRKTTETRTAGTLGNRSRVPSTALQLHCTTCNQYRQATRKPLDMLAIERSLIYSCN